MTHFPQTPRSTWVVLKTSSIFCRPTMKIICRLWHRRAISDNDHRAQTSRKPLTSQPISQEPLRDLTSKNNNNAIPRDTNNSDINGVHHRRQHQQQRLSTPLLPSISTTSKNYTHLLQELRFEKLLKHVIETNLLEKRNLKTRITKGLLEKCFTPTYVQARIDRLSIQLRESQDRIKKVREEVAWLGLQALMDVRPGVLPMELLVMVKEWLLVCREREENGGRLFIPRRR